MSTTERAQLINRVLSCTSELFRSMHSGQDEAWLTLELTMPQLKTLVRVSHLDAATSGQIARGLGVSLSTVTGIVDRLAEQQLVSRREDPDDRRITRVELTPRGRALVDQLLRYRDQQITAMLSQLDEAQLEVVEQAFHYLVTSAERLAADKQEVAVA